MSFTATAFISQTGILTALLLGFAITAIVQLVVWRDAPKAGKFAMGAFFVSVAGLLITIWLNFQLSLGMSSSITLTDISPGGRLAWTISVMFFAFALGMIGFIVGLTALGYAHSKALGEWATWTVVPAGLIMAVIFVVMNFY